MLIALEQEELVDPLVVYLIIYCVNSTWTRRACRSSSNLFDYKVLIAFEQEELVDPLVVYLVIYSVNSTWTRRASLVLNKNMKDLNLKKILMQFSFSIT